MLAKIYSSATVGLESVVVTVEVDISSQGLPSFTVVGLPDKAVEESRERVRAAIKNSGADFPPRRITVNLAPADLPKEGPQYDLPIALGILLASGQISADVSKMLCIGELSLDGTLRHTNGVLPAALLARENSFERIFIPSLDSGEAVVVSGIEVYPVDSLLQLFRHLSQTAFIAPRPFISFSEINDTREHEFDFADVKGQEQAKRVLEIAAAGGHNVFLKGPPGAGKTLLARTLPSILPQLTESEAYEVTNIYSVTGNLPLGQSLIKHRPFRAPHHTTSRVGLIGGGTHPMPGEISLAHRGVLFLDEFPEFPRSVLEALRQPLEDGFVSISRAAGSVRYPAQFILIAAANPCPCGNYGDATKRCVCSSSSITRYQKRISGPILDRIDLHLEVPAVETAKLVGSEVSESSSKIVDRVESARKRQQSRYQNIKKFCNAELKTKDIKSLRIESAAFSLLEQAMSKLHISARSYYKLIKVAQTIADLADRDEVLASDIAEAIQYRPKNS